MSQVAFFQPWIMIYLRSNDPPFPPLVLLPPPASASRFSTFFADKYIVFSHDWGRLNNLSMAYTKGLYIVTKSKIGLTGQWGSANIYLMYFSWLAYLRGLQLLALPNRLYCCLHCVWASSSVFHSLQLKSSAPHFTQQVYLTSPDTQHTSPTVSDARGGCDRGSEKRVVWREEKNVKNPQVHHNHVITLSNGAQAQRTAGLSVE